MWGELVFMCHFCPFFSLLDPSTSLLEASGICYDFDFSASGNTHPNLWSKLFSSPRYHLPSFRKWFFGIKWEQLVQNDVFSECFELNQNHARFWGGAENKMNIRFDLNSYWALKIFLTRDYFDVGWFLGAQAHSIHRFFQVTRWMT